MKKYELMVIFKTNLEEEKRNELLEKFKGIITVNGELENIDEWGTRKLAYEIDKVTEGYYVLIHFKSGVDVPKELDRNLRINENVMRHLIVNMEE